MASGAQGAVPLMSAANSASASIRARIGPSAVANRRKSLRAWVSAASWRSRVSGTTGALGRRPRVGTVWSATGALLDERGTEAFADAQTERPRRHREQDRRQPRLARQPQPARLPAEGQRIPRPPGGPTA